MQFPALGRLDFFETALAFMAGYGIRSFLIAQSLNQIDKAYGQNHSILDNCHVRVTFATNDERTAKRISEMLGTATELRAQRNYAGHRLAPWLGPLDGVAPGNRAPTADAGRSDAASARRGRGDGVQRGADQGEEAALLRGRAISSAACCRRLRLRPASTQMRRPHARTTGAAWRFPPCPPHRPPASAEGLGLYRSTAARAVSPNYSEIVAYDPELAVPAGRPRAAR